MYDISGTSEAGVIAYQRNSDETAIIGSCGCVSNNVKVMIIDEETRKLVGSNIKGEIWCKTPCIAPSSVTECKSDVFNGLLQLFLIQYRVYFATRKVKVSARCRSGIFKI